MSEAVTHMAGPTFLITDDTTAADVAECLAHLNASAKRCPCVLGTMDYPSEWDRWHRRIDVVLDEWAGRA